jgi:hypothetical protein
MPLLRHPLGALAALLLAGASALPTAAEAAGRHAGAHAHRAAPVHAGHWRGGHRHRFHGHHHGHGWAGVTLGIGLGALMLGRPWDPVVVERPVPVYVDPSLPPPQYLSEAVPVPPRAPDPVIYPSRGQSADQIEADRQACNRWATTQRDAMADASVFHRATLACLEGRGYTVR